MKASFLGLCLLVVSIPWSYAQQNPSSPPDTSNARVEQELLDLSRQKWLWMADRNVDALAALFQDEAVFVHMGGTMTRDQELGVIRSGGIHDKHAGIQAVSEQSKQA